MGRYGPGRDSEYLGPQVPSDPRIPLIIENFKRQFTDEERLAARLGARLAPDKNIYTAQGHQCFDRKQPPAGTWESVFSEDADTITGNPISPRGMAMKLNSTRPLREQTAPGGLGIRGRIRLQRIRMLFFCSVENI